ncbi:HNH endonuclease signature motif containing protein [Caldimonas tepidiphila]|uniref:HNH endonuclease signature motif containing protein n=1 Tax=Caldimonas tepidiphila TaxID=2315841 RepID=UPI000E5BD2DD|nr:HNH endonuclease signature motif containing protein [Caldimonas tepidiphila]
MVARRAVRGAEPFGPAAKAGPPVCPLCGRPIVPGPSADEHHLVPVSEGGRDKVLVHRICHRKIHATFSEKELAREFHTWEALRAHPEIAAFVRWVAGKPPEYYDRSVRPRRRR